MRLLAGGKPSSSFIRQLVDSARTYAMIGLDRQGLITFWSRGAEMLLGWSEPEVLGKSGDLIFVPADRKIGVFEQELIRANDEGDLSDFRWYINRGGSCFWANAALHLLDEGLGYVKLIRDSTHHQTPQDHLGESEARVPALKEGLSPLIWRSRDGGDWIEGGPQWCSYTGQTVDDSRGLGWLNAVHPDDRERTIEAWRAAMTNDLLEVEHRLIRASVGSYRWFGTRAVPLKTVEGQGSEWLGTSMDIHDIKALQEHQDVLLAEIQHRTRNLLAIVRSISAQTAQTTPGFLRPRTS